MLQRNLGWGWGFSPLLKAIHIDGEIDQTVEDPLLDIRHSFRLPLTFRMGRTVNHFQAAGRPSRLISQGQIVSPVRCIAAPHDFSYESSISSQTSRPKLDMNTKDGDEGELNITTKKRKK